MTESIEEMNFESELRIAYKTDLLTYKINFVRNKSHKIKSIQSCKVWIWNMHILGCEIEEATSNMYQSNQSFTAGSIQSNVESSI